MRTTLTLDPDVVQLIADRVHQDRVSMKRVVNAALRRGLAESEAAPQQPYRMTSHPGTLQASVDVGSMNRLADEIEDAGIIEAQSR